MHDTGRRSYVMAPDGSPLTLADLPTPGNERWVAGRKANVVAAVRGGLITLEEVCSRYRLTPEEFLSWRRSIDKHGMLGLRATKIQQYRTLSPPEAPLSLAGKPEPSPPGDPYATA